jgi:hypothetical protein
MKSRRTYGLLVIFASLGVFPMGCCWCRPWGHHCCYPPEAQTPQAATSAAPPAVTFPVQPGSEIAVSVGK